MVKVSMALYWKFILQENIIKYNKRIFRFQDKNGKPHYYSLRQIKVL